MDSVLMDHFIFIRIMIVGLHMLDEQNQKFEEWQGSCLIMYSGLEWAFQLTKCLYKTRFNIP
jgi:hypothetical protein